LSKSADGLAVASTSNLFVLSAGGAAGLVLLSLTTSSATPFDEPATSFADDAGLLPFIFCLFFGRCLPLPFPLPGVLVLAGAGAGVVVVVVVVAVVVVVVVEVVVDGSLNGITLSTEF
jgi:hypothetical protein